MRNFKDTKLILFIVILGCIIMAIVESIISPIYIVKSFVKIFLFLLIPMVYLLYQKKVDFKKLFKFDKDTILVLFFCGIGIYVFILGCYFALRSVFDLSNVTHSLEASANINKNNFVFVAIYISFINSLLEEFFFRGFAFLILKEVSNDKFANIFSASIFVIYHITIIGNWFSSSLFVLLIISLFIGGLFFNYIDKKYKNIYPSWIIHVAANLSINTIGFILFGII